MIIEKVELQNFRNHINKTVNFYSGINLLYGKNGSGKTSILEAIGITLFHSELRNKNNKVDAVTEGQKNAKIKVHFLADDGLRYIAEKNLPSGISKLTQIDNKNFSITGKNEIQVKIRELLGIKLNSDKFFSNIIVASQNKITDIFADTPAERRKNFDSIFNMEVYSQISTDYLRKAETAYKSEFDKKNEVINDLKSKLIDSDELNSDIHKFQDKLNLLLNESSNLNQSLEICGQQLIELRKNKIQIESCQNLLKSNEARKADILSSITKQKSDLENALKSRDIVSKNKVQYEKYSALASDLKVNEQKITELEKILKQIQLLKDELSENKNNLTKLNSDIESEKKRSTEYQNELEILIKNSNVTESEKNELAKNYETKLNDFNSFKVISSSWESNEKEKNDILQKINNLNIEINTLSSGLADLELIRKQKSALISQIELSDIKISKREELRRVRDRLNERLSANQEAHTKLSDGICPFLTEDCLNVKQGSGIASYFRNKANEINSEIESNKLQLSEFDNLDNEIQILRKELNNLDQIIISNETNLLKINKLKDSITIENAGLENTNLKLSLLFSEKKQFLEQHNFDIQSIKLIQLTDYINSLKTEAERSKILFDEKNNSFKILQNEIHSKNENINRLILSINSITNQIILLTDSQSKLSEKISSLEFDSQTYQSVKQKSEAIKSELEILNPYYKDYIQNLKSSEQVETIQLNILNDSEILNKIESELLELQFKLEELNKIYNESLYKDKSDEYEKFKEQLSLKSDEIAGLKTQIKLLEERIELNNRNISQISNLNNFCVTLEQKRNLTNELRENMKLMGQMIANKLLVIIQTIATENFRLISGRMESIIWKSDLYSNDAYQVSIKTVSGINRNFELLSGGEQMMVAISLRAAMNSLLTNSKFVIFDEPTVNLDTEKRKALSESLFVILKSLDQAIIVTHDDTFKEMAQNIIELN